MRVIKISRVEQWGRQYPDAANALSRWAELVKAAAWNSISDVRRDFPHADAVTVASGRPVTIFNIRGNHYRLVAAIHYNTRIVYVLRFMRHGEYDKGKWKDEL